MPQKILAILKKGAYIARKWRWTCFEFVRHVFFAPSMVLKQVKNFRREGYEVWMDDLFLEAFAVDEMIALLQAKNVIPSFSGANEAVKDP